MTASLLNSTLQTGLYLWKNKHALRLFIQNEFHIVNFVISLCLDQQMAAY